ncbi:serine hydrolase [Modestobacter italicus]|uniref:serine hydrolase n=1 Tax=Modestobacter italicus (strain DSM 44449 / CECT 9708 / BC 501) TaxID=2732864 RepID=UPI001C94AF8C|nr:serine hydrolase [Modestobacter italicus]
MVGSRARIAGVAVTGVLVAGLLVSPVLCSAGSARTPDETLPVTSLRQLERPSARVPLATTPRPPVDRDAVLAGLQAAALPAGVALDAVVLDRDAAVLVSTPAADRPVPSASLVKLLVVQQLLARAAVGVLTLGPADLARMERAVTASDDTAMSLLWDAHDGADLVRSAAATFGLTGTAPPAESGQWGEASMSAADTGRFLAALTAGAPGAEVLLGWMRNATATAADGFDQRFGLLAAGPGGGVAGKQGWMCCVAGQRHLHSAGVLGDGRTVVLLGEAPSSVSWTRARRALDEAAAVLVAGTA